MKDLKEGDLVALLRNPTSKDSDKPLERSVHWAVYAGKGEFICKVGSRRVIEVFSFPTMIDRMFDCAPGVGLDPNVWFGNVERVASERIGRETVTYVSNIYKYYITYRLLADQQERREAAKAEVGKRK